MTPITTILGRLSKGETLLLAGACGTEIQRRGVRTELPLWSASALLTHPEIVQQVHRDYLDAGADIISTNTFRTNLRTFEGIGKPEQARELTLKACALAQRARKESGKSGAAIGGSIAPVEDCYHPERVPDEQSLDREHSALISWFVEGGVDFLFIETMNCIREALAAARAAQRSGLPFFVSFLCDPQGNLFSGESLGEAVEAILPLGPAALLTNCRPLDTIGASLQKLLQISPVPVGIYANGDGEPDDECGWKFHGENPEQRYLEHAKQWRDAGAQIIGGCCGTTPEYVRLLKKQLFSTPIQ